MKTVPKIPSPTITEVDRYLKKWDELDDYVLQEKSLELLFKKTFPENKNIEHILIKVCCLNDFYSTNIFSPFKVAEHIYRLNIDKHLSAKDGSIVNILAKIEMKKGRVINFYSFATKYCSHHFPQDYPIFDYYVERILMHFNKEDKFSKFKKEDLLNYNKFKKILIDFKNYYNLNNYDLKDIDRYIWQLGKKYFPRKYKSALPYIENKKITSDEKNNE